MKKHIIVIDHPNSYTDYHNIPSQNDYETQIKRNLQKDTNVASVQFIYPDGEQSETFADNYGPYKTRYFQIFSDKSMQTILNHIPKDDEIEIQLNAHGKTGMPRFEMRCREGKFLKLSELAKIINTVANEHDTHKVSFQSNSCNFMTNEEDNKYYNMILPLPMNHNIDFKTLPQGSVAGKLLKDLHLQPNEIRGANYYSFTDPELNTSQISTITAQKQTTQGNKGNKLLEHFNNEMYGGKF